MYGASGSSWVATSTACAVWEKALEVNVVSHHCWFVTSTATCSALCKSSWLAIPSAKHSTTSSTVWSEESGRRLGNRLHHATATNRGFRCVRWRFSRYRHMDTGESHASHSASVIGHPLELPSA